MKRSDKDPFDDFFESMNEIMERIWEQLEGDFAQQTWGYRMTNTPEEPVKFERFGEESKELRQTTKADIIEEEDVIRIVMDLPGVEKDNINIEATNLSVKIDAIDGDRSYSEKINLSTGINPKTGKASYNNGVLDLTFEKHQEKRA